MVRDLWYDTRVAGSQRDPIAAATSNRLEIAAGLGRRDEELTMR